MIHVQVLEGNAYIQRVGTCTSSINPSKAACQSECLNVEFRGTEENWSVKNVIKTKFIVLSIAEEEALLAEQVAQDKDKQEEEEGLFGTSDEGESCDLSHAYTSNMMV